MQAKILINTKTLGDLDKAAKMYCALHHARDFPYQSFSETVSLVLVLLLRHLLQYSEGNQMKKKNHREIAVTVYDSLLAILYHCVIRNLSLF